MRRAMGEAGVMGWEVFLLVPAGGKAKVGWVQLVLVLVEMELAVSGVATASKGMLTASLVRGSTALATEGVAAEGVAPEATTAAGWGASVAVGMVASWARALMALVVVEMALVAKAGMEREAALMAQAVASMAKEMAN